MACHDSWLEKVRSRVEHLQEQEALQENASLSEAQVYAQKLGGIQ